MVWCRHKYHGFAVAHALRYCSMTCTSYNDIAGFQVFEAIWNPLVDCDVAMPYRFAVSVWVAIRHYDFIFFWKLQQDFPQDTGYESFLQPLLCGLRPSLCFQRSWRRKGAGSFSVGPLMGTKITGLSKGSPSFLRNSASVESSSGCLGNIGPISLTFFLKDFGMFRLPSYIV